MILNNVDFETYFKHYPDKDGFFEVSFNQKVSLSVVF